MRSNCMFTIMRDMTELASASTEQLPELIAGRYLVEELIGRGGMALVGRVVDQTSGERLALKRMRTTFEGMAAERTEALFQREYRMLAELAHPRIVKVFDYGLDGHVPYYTMELLDGGDLFERTPLPWQQACSIARDVCSALSLVHARRMVYRDLSPRNVRCTGDGTGKIIDFGAMAPMGTAKVAVCTPAVAAPEVVNLQPLDGRADLYALGATLYQTLTGRAPYPARTFRQLPELWEAPLRPPSAYVAEIPEALDSLVLELLQLDSALRPLSAAEVGERLSALAGLPAAEHLLVSQAYLTTPTLVGRDKKVERVRRRLQRLNSEGMGGSLLVLGSAGLGRTRLLDACVLQAKLAGITALRVDGEAGAGERLSVAIPLIQQLLEANSERAVWAAEDQWDALCHLLPPLRKQAPERAVQALDPKQVQQQALPVLRKWLLRFVEQQPVLLVVDEVERLDAESRNLIALLAERARRHPLLLLVSRDADLELECDALRILEGSSRELRLQPLTLGQSQALLASIFGEVPNLQALVERLHALSGGNPRSLMQLAQHLLDQGVVRHTAGAWVLPADIAELSLPQNMAEALQEIVAALEPESRRLAQGMALAGEELFSFNDCLRLCRAGASAPGGRDTPAPQAAADAALYGNLSELIGAGLLLQVGDDYRLADPQWVEPLLAKLEAATESALQDRLAQVFLRRDDVIRACRHLLRCGKEIEALERLAKHAEESSSVTNVDPDAFTAFLDQLPADWQAIYGRALTLAKDHGASRRLVYALRNRLLGIASQFALPSSPYTLPICQALADEAGLDLYAQLDDVQDPTQRVKQAIGAAIARHEARAPEEQLFDPIVAIRHLSRALLSSIGPLSNSLDTEEWAQLPSLAAFEPLSPASSIVHALERGFDARLCGRFHQAQAIYQGILDRISSDEDLGLEPTYVEGMRAGICAVLGMLEAVAGQPQWRERVEAIADSPIHGPNAMLVHGIAAVWAGDAKTGDAIERERELQRLELRRPRTYEPLALLWRFQAYVGSQDLTRARQEISEIERFSRRLPSWKPILSWARGEYDRIRGANAEALEHLDEALKVFAPGKHYLWAYAAGSRLLALCSLRREGQARQEGQAQLQQACEQDLGHLCAALNLPLAIAAARQGDAESAWSQIEAALQCLDAHRIGGLSRGIAYEVAASVAVYLEDTASFDRYAPLCREIFLAHENRTLASRYERLQRAAKRHQLSSEEPLPQGTSLTCATEQLSQLRSLLQTCAEPRDCLQACLALIGDNAGAQAAYMFTLVNGEPRLHSQSAPGALPASILQAVRSYVQAEIADDMDTAQDDGESLDAMWTDEDGAVYLPLLLSHRGPSGFVISGVALLKSNGGVLPSETLELAEHVSRFMADTGSFETQISA